MSMEEEEARLAATAQPTSAPVLEPSTPKATIPTTETVPADPVDEGEAAMLGEAMAVSKSNDEPMEEDEDDDDEEEAIQKAIAMSMRKEDKEEKKS